MKGWWLVLVSILATASQVVLASENAFFYVSKAEPMCFVDEVMQTATLLIKYRYDDFSTKPLQIILSLRGRTLKTEAVNVNEGKFAFAALETGIYRICIQPDDSRPGLTFPVLGQAKFYFQSQVLTNSAPNEVPGKTSSIVKAKQVISLQQELDQVSDTVDLLLHKIQMARERETHFRDQSERINERVIWWSVIQTLFLIFVGAFQAVHLHSFFMQKKIA